MSVDTTGMAQQQTGSPGTLPNNPGWDPYGPSDASHQWWNVYSGNVTFNLPGNNLNLVWGSPNYDDPNDTNYFVFYSGANGTGTLLGTVRASDLYADFGSSIDNNNHAGYLISIATSGNFGSVIAGTDNGASDFEFAILGEATATSFAPGVPEPSTWAMMLLGFVGLGYAGFRRSRQPVAMSF